jgi:hypothetical protein
MTYLVIGDGGHGKSPARFDDVVQAMDYASALARAGLSAGVYQQLAYLSADQAKPEC